SVGPDHANTIDALNGLAFVYFTRGEFDRADAPLREALRAARTHGDDELKRVSDLTANLHVARQQNGDYEEALTLLQESAALSARLPDYDPDDNAIVQGNMAVLLSDMGRHEEALQMRRDALAHWQSAYPPGSPMSVNALMGYGLQLHEVGRPEEGLPYIQESVDLYRSIAESESEPYQLVGALISYGTVLTAADRTTQAAEVLGEAQRLVEASLPPSTSLSARLASAQAGLFQARGEWDAAVRAADRAVETFAAAGRADADGVGWTLATKARALIEGGQRDEALAALRRARAIFSDRYGDAHPAVSTMDSLRAVARS
ncbi:MAG: tetratricopeptide repeat protein, partial [Bacteroidota bacterium]